TQVGHRHGAIFWREHQVAPGRLRVGELDAGAVASDLERLVHEKVQRRATDLADDDDRRGHALMVHETSCRTGATRSEARKWPSTWLHQTCSGPLVASGARHWGFRWTCGCSDRSPSQKVTRR